MSLLSRDSLVAARFVSCLTGPHRVAEIEAAVNFPQERLTAMLLVQGRISSRPQNRLTGW